MRILLINPPVTAPTRDPLYVTEPLGLACLEPCLTRRGHDVTVFDALGEAVDRLTPHRDGFRQGLTNEEIERRLEGERADAIGITCMFSPHFRDAVEVAEACKRYLPDAPVIIGGTHTTFEDVNSLSLCEAIDYVVRGEGEETIVDLLDVLEAGGSVDRVLGLTYRQDGVPVRNPMRPLIADLDALPMPNRGILMMETYFRHKTRFGAKKGANPATVVTSRGCPFHCRFCNVAGTWGGRSWRPFSAPRVLQEILDLYGSYGAREISIADDNFVVDKRRVEAILDGIIERRLALSLRVAAGIPLWTIDEEFLRKLRRAGLFRLNMPIESGSPETIEYMSKRIDLAHAKEIIALAKRMGLWTESNFIIGFPYETEKHIAETREFILSSGLDEARVNLALSYPGSRLLDDAVREGLVHPGPRYHEVAYTRSPGSVAFRREELERFRDEISRAFTRRKIELLLNPVAAFRDLYPRVNSWSGFTYFLRILRTECRRRWMGGLRPARIRRDKMVAPARGPERPIRVAREERDRVPA